MHTVKENGSPLACHPERNGVQSGGLAMDEACFLFVAVPRRGG